MLEARAAELMTLAEANVNGDALNFTIRQLQKDITRTRSQARFIIC